MRLAILLAFASTAIASSGDRLEPYQQCLSLCQQRSCPPYSHYSPPLALQLTHWSCQDDCKYACMHQVTDRDEQMGQRIHQYYGKWPFIRLAGMQEPASVAFSMLNLWFHANGYRRVKRALPDEHPMKPYYLTWAIISVNAWIWSSVFHTRDLPWTEKMDYFSAASTILYALYYTIIRLFHLYPTPPRTRMVIPSPPSSPTSALHKLWTLTCTIIFISHIGYLTLLPSFDYTYNIIFNLVLGITHNIFWLIYALPESLTLIHRFTARSKSYRPPSVSNAAILVALTMAATTLELFDFPPWGRTIDAHSLWHLATAPLVYLFYSFLIQDALDAGWREHKA